MALKPPCITLKYLSLPGLTPPAGVVYQIICILYPNIKTGSVLYLCPTTLHSKVKLMMIDILITRHLKLTCKAPFISVL